MAEIDKLIEDVGRLYEKLEGFQKRQDQFTEQHGKRIDDTNAWFVGIQKLLELMVQAEMSKMKDN